MKNRYRFALNLAWACGLLVVPANAVNLFNITFNYSGGADAYTADFEAAAAIWERIIPSYTSASGNPLTGITIDASLAVLGSGVLGSAGPGTPVSDGAGHWLPSTGIMQLNSSSVGSLGSDLLPIILHEMAHVIGVGTLWTNNSVYTNLSGAYTGVNGLASYNSEFGQSASVVPVELGGGAGTADSHWNETDGGTALVGVSSNIFNRDMAYELMTGWANLDQPNFISNMTRASLSDIGYNTQQASIRTWSGGSGETIWGSTENWGDIAAAPYDVVTFPALATGVSVTLDSPDYVDTLQLNNGGSVLIKDGTLNVWNINATTAQTTTFKNVIINEKPNLSLASGSIVKFLNTDLVTPASVTVTDVSGMGQIGGNITVEGTHSPGGLSAISSQTFLNNLSYTNGTIFDWQLFDPSTTNGNYDSVVVNGNLTVDGIFSVLLNFTPNFGDTFWTTQQTWTNVYQVGGTATGSFDSFEMWDLTLGNPITDYSSYGNFSYQNIGGSLVWVPVPEPTSALAGLLIGGGLLRRRREARPGAR